MFKKVVPYITLFSSFSTLICCAIPALLVTLGLGASLASFLGNYPQLIWLSEHKNIVFSFAGIMLFCTWLIRRADNSCPMDPELARTCRNAKRVSGIIFYGSVVIYCIGGFFAFVAPYIF